MQRTAAILALILLFAAPLSLHAQSTYTAEQANQIFSNASAYVATINQSSYLVFSPNLTKAYSYLNRSQNLLNKSPSGAVAYADLATSSAQSSYQRIEGYREISALGALVFTIAMALILYRFMIPVKRASRR